ncbi:MAG: ABC transporter permease [Clostridia bacterium]|nr:ABC transporter permease [Clostridia bacterium]MBR5364683.1 ABC transporter permease [Clostridia bacterium]
MSAVYKKELRTHLNGMTGAIVIAFLLLMVGIYTIAYNLRGMYPNFETTVSAASFLYVLAIPVLTMRSVAEEKHAKTDQLLYSLPMSMTQIVLAKYFAMVTILAIPCGVICFYPLILGSFGTVRYSTAYAMILAFFLLGAALIAIGMFLSSLTESQVIAAVLTLAILLLLNFMSGLATLIPSSAAASLAGFLILALIAAVIVRIMTKNTTVAVSAGVILAAAMVLVYAVDASLYENAIPRLFSALALFDRLSPFSQGLFDVTAIVFYLSAAALFVYLTVQSMEKKRWN